MVKAPYNILVTKREGNVWGWTQIHREVGVKKGIYFGAGIIQSQTQAGVGITEGQIEGRSKDRVSEYTNQGRSREVRNTFNM